MSASRAASAEAASSAGIGPSVNVPLSSDLNNERFLRHRVDNPAGRVFFSDRNLNGNDGPAAGLPERLQRATEARAIPIEPVQDDQAGQLELLGGGSDLFGLNHHGRRCGDDDQGGVGDAQGRARVGQEVADPRGVNQVDLVPVPLGVGDAGRQRMLPCNRFFIEVGNRLCPRPLSRTDSPCRHRMRMVEASWVLPEPVCPTGATFLMLTAS